MKKKTYLCIAFEKERAFSSAGLEHLPYKQRVGGSNPSTPTIENLHLFCGGDFFFSIHALRESKKNREKSKNDDAFARLSDLMLIFANDYIVVFVPRRARA